MRIEKWYLDCVAEDGTGVIGYAARINWGPLAMHCSETLQWQAGAVTARNRTVLGGSLPVASSYGIAWKNPRLAAHGRWEPSAVTMPTTILHEEAAGRLEWTCLCPAADATVLVANQKINGSGYAERLVMTLPITRMPIRELRWGRFIAAHQSLVWIRWRGPVERHWCFHNGRSVEADMPELHQLAWSGHRLRLSEGLTLRTGPIAATAFKDAPLARWLTPSAVLDIDETKWCSRGVLTDATGQDHAGWAIHEVAFFP